MKYCGYACSVNSDLRVVIRTSLPQLSPRYLKIVLTSGQRKKTDMFLIKSDNVTNISLQPLDQSVFSITEKSETVKLQYANL